MKNIDNLTLKDLKNGYELCDNSYKCIFCDEEFQNGEIYKHEDRFYDAKAMVKNHIHDVHNSVLYELLELDKKQNMLSSVQKRMLSYFAAKKTDKEISELTKTSLSTVRQQRYQLKEKARQAKVLLAIYELSADAKDFKAYIDIHQSARMVDDRYLTTLKEEQEILNKVFEFDPKLRMKVFPAKQKQKVVVLKRIAEQLCDDKKYTEKEINMFLESIYDDYVTLRRYLIEYGFLERTDDGQWYWKP
ncbi:hypothetical protein M2475_000265 [Breznakia sp. PF5-3]|uniref:DUF2087 domain-containing protein n=1 Tax=unclassified Breznakia TaxID=2623764 RepID=UPI0024052B25|nr:MULTISPECIES: DUF2087 domain-containing protein [unclassified Breznakia]MDL2276478.1 DUF2087 domain-containing protein [Breznakia sp. OttesenSCG-928-G09]MDF9823917.1 hypothetical protein [Breznakia sp. PM6-1]MDF9834716.1 hypothetical protein [Breznakia sp. PF5-3]MDF9836849.1 hypothetical protein [Breznakia sp. PFB2-8]MDF9858866.1 hypothetical protein [Breznakia sp. PH5-24]